MGRLIDYTVLLVILLSPVVHAETNPAETNPAETNPAETGQNPEPASTGLEFPHPGDVYFYLGNFTAEETPGELDHPSSDFALGLGMGYRHGQYWGMRYEMQLTSAKYDTPPTVSGGLFTVVDNRMVVSSLGLLVSPYLRYDMDSVGIYAGAGLGFVFSNLTVNGSTLGIPVEHTENSSDIGTIVYLGLRADFETASLAIEYRQFDADGDFAPVTSDRDVEVGGKLVLMIYSFRF